MTRHQFKNQTAKTLATIGIMSSTQQLAMQKVQLVEIQDNASGQRLDNFLITRLKGVPKSHIYRIVRKGEVRINKGRVDVSYRLEIGDVVRIPPIRMTEKTEQIFIPSPLRQALEDHILFEDDVLLILDKPSGYPVHGGTGINAGVIEGLRQIRPNAQFLELVHRLDKDTSGCLLIAKKRSILRQLHEMFRGDQIQKTYTALLSGQWLKIKQSVNVALQKNINKGGERFVMVNQEGKPAETLFNRMQLFTDCTLVEAAPKTGRTHQIRVHAAWLGHPIIGDERYGQDEVNRKFKSKGYNRMFLHAAKLEFTHPKTGEKMSVKAPLPQDLQERLSNEKPV